MDRIFLVHHTADQRFARQLRIALEQHDGATVTALQWPQQTLPFERSSGTPVAILVSPQSVDDPDPGFKFLIGSELFARQNTAYVSLKALKLDHLLIHKQAPQVADATPQIVAQKLLSIFRQHDPPVPLDSTQKTSLLDEAPQPVIDTYGKEDALKYLSGELLSGKRNAVALCGFNGTGKTATVRLFLDQAITIFQFAVWISLKRKRTLEDVVIQLSRLPDLQLDELTKLQLGPAHQLFKLIKEHSIVLVLDNFESLWSHEQRDDLEGDPIRNEYVELLRLLSENSTVGKLIITTVEPPPFFANSQLPEHLLVQYDMVAPANDLFAAFASARGVTATVEDARQINKTIGGNFVAWIEILRHAERERKSLADLSHDKELLLRVLPENIPEYVESFPDDELAVLFQLAISVEPLRLDEITNRLKYLGSPYELQPVYRRLERHPAVELLIDGRWQLQFWARRAVLDLLAKLLCDEIRGESALKWVRNIRLLEARAPEFVQDEQRKFIRDALLPAIRTHVGLLHIVGEKLIVLLKSYQGRAESGFLTANLFDLARAADIPLTNQKFTSLLCEQVDFRAIEMRNTHMVDSEFIDCMFSDSFGPVTAVLAFGSADNELLAAGTFSGEVRLWTRDGRTVASFPCGDDWISALIQDEGERGSLISACMDGSINRIDCQTQSMWQLAHFKGKKIRSVVQSKLRDIWAACDDGHIRILSSRNAVVDVPVSTRRLIALCISNEDDKELIFAGGDDGFVYECNASTRVIENKIDLDGQRVRALALSPSGNILFVAHEFELSRWERLEEVGWKKVANIPAPMRLWDVSYDPVRDRLFQAGNDGVIRILDGSTLGPIANIPGHSSWIRALHIFNNGTNIISGSEDQSLRIWDVESLRCLNTIRGVGHRIFSIATHGPDIFCGTGSHKVIRFTRHKRTKGAKEQDLAGHKDQVFVISCATRQGVLASGSDDGVVITWDCRTGKKVSEARLHSGWIGALAFSPNEQYLASGGDDRAVVIQDCKTGSKRVLSNVHTSRISGLKFVDDTHLLALCEGGYLVSIDIPTGTSKSFSVTTNLLYSIDVASNNPTIAICGDSIGQLHLVDFDTGSSKIIHANEGSSPIWCIATKQSERIAAFGADDGCVQLLDLKSLSIINTTQAHKGQVWSITWTENPDELITSGEDGTVAIWRTPWKKEHDRYRASRLYERMNLRGAMGLGHGEILVLRKLGANV